MCKKDYGKLDLTQFNPIKTEGAAYVLGILATDGNISKYKGFYRLRLELQYSDLQWLKLLKKLIGFKNPIQSRSRFDNRTGSTNKTCFFQVGSKELKDVLVKQYGITPKKSLTLKYPKNLNKRLTRHFIRGVWEGDGGCGLYEKSNSQSVFITGASLSFLKNIKQVLKNEDIDSYIGISDISSSGNSCYKLHINYGSILKFYNYLYYNSKFFLKRKRQQYDKIINYRKYRIKNELQYGVYRSEKQLKLLKKLSKASVLRYLDIKENRLKLAKKLKISKNVLKYNLKKIKDFKIKPPK